MAAEPIREGLEHDPIWALAAIHCGEISQLLGSHGLPAIDLWRRAT